MNRLGRVFTARNLGRAVVAALVTASPLLYGQLPASAAGAAYNLDQWANVAPGSWQNGSLNQNQATYTEGDVVPFRATLTGLSAGAAYTVRIGYDFTKSSRYAYDYLTTFNTTETTVDACTGVAGVDCSLTDSTPAIPADTSLPFTMPTGTMILYGGGTLDGFSGYGLNTSGGGNSSKFIDVTFTAPTPAADLVLAWGGHVASEVNWGVGQAAATVNGASYHVSLDAVSANWTGGAQDRSIQVTKPALLTIDKVTKNADGTFNFTSTGGSFVPANFSIQTTANAGTAGPYSLANFGQAYTVTEAAPGAGWALTKLECTNAARNGTTATTDLATRTITIPNPTAGDTFTCTFTNEWTASPGLTLAKAANPTTYTAAGQVITYTYTLTNSGNTTLIAPITVTDDHIGTFTCWNSDMAPGDVETCTATYTIAVADMSATKVTNVAHANATRGPQSNDATATVTNTYSPPPVIPPGPSFTPAPALSIAKTGTPATYDHVGQVITYTYTLKNTGNVALSGPFSVTDNKVGTFTCSTASSLAIGATAICTNSYTITAADLAGTSVVNSATGKGFYNGTAVNSDPATFSVQALHPAISVSKTAAPTSVTAPPGATVTFTYVVTNTGDTVLAPVTVTDDHLGDVGTAPSLAPGASVTFTKATFITAGSPISNVATASGTDPMGLTVSATATATISIVAGEVITPPATVAPAPAPTPTPVPVLPFTGAPVAGRTLVGSGLVGFGWLLLTSSRRGRKHRR